MNLADVPPPYPAPVPPPPPGVQFICSDGARAVFAHNADVAGWPLSLAKLATALLWAGWISDPDVVLEVEPRHLAGGSSGGHRVGDRVSLLDLLYTLLLPSGNDSALLLADHIGTIILQAEERDGEPRSRFVEAMNALVHGLGGSSSFTTPHGLDRTSRASPSAIALLMKAACDAPTLRQVMGTKTHKVRVVGCNARTYSVTHSAVALLEDHGVIAAKTGSSTPGRSYCMASLSESPSRQLITVTMGSPSPERRLQDHRITVTTARGLCRS